MPNWPILPFSLIIGSWLGVIIRRFGTGRAPIWGRSLCEHCCTTLGPPDLIPILSFLVLRGKCRHCGAPIGLFQPAIELAAFAVAILSYLANDSGTKVWLDAGLGLALLTASWIDAEQLVLPDLITLPLILAGLAATSYLRPIALFGHAAAAALGYMGFVLLNAAYRAWRHHDGLGQGDAKLFAAAGAWLGATLMPDELLMSGIIGLASAGVLFLCGTDISRAKLPFGPALALALFVLQLTCDQLGSA